MSQKFSIYIIFSINLGNNYHSVKSSVPISSITVITEAKIPGKAGQSKYIVNQKVEFSQKQQ